MSIDAFCDNPLRKIAEIDETWSSRNCAQFDRQSQIEEVDEEHRPSTERTGEVSIEMRRSPLWLRPAAWRHRASNGRAKKVWVCCLCDGDNTRDNTQMKANELRCSHLMPEDKR
jgi:hypothetical protein